ncbi:ribosomal subunit interface protein [Candidatus Uhrbacteria bacterium CG10_big_fil_rev_8_21_14_0_10_48_11]|uniref:Ribosomal subunit interface protein n=1 Tax=Candidatus Uhrbacteria bacterium CG10_big_fil_rev_8_21_14_0_10_48_11 TaxID=1975037 RepID=A0A2M8LEF8_9BACT|nr:MAG: ribosomal subunit interface protein [Candidatus Uhrbacteria bacterium CG10_big_fil_rev_8_21_14_0_10_48_11]
MNIHIKAIDIELTSALDTYVQQKIGALVKFYPDVLRIEVEVERTTQHHQKGEKLFRSGAKVAIPKHTFFAEAYAADMYRAIDVLRDELKKEMNRLKTKRLDKSRGKA